jgi:hypothetical protein
MDSAGLELPLSIAICIGIAGLLLGEKILTSRRLAGTKWDTQYRGAFLFVVLTIFAVSICGVWASLPEAYVGHLIDDDGISRASIISAAPLFAVFCMALCRKFHKHPKGTRIVVISTLILVVPFLGIAVNITKIVNRKFDNSPSMIRHSIVWEKDYGRNRYAPGHYFFWLKSWNHPGKFIYLPVDEITYERAVPKKSGVKLFVRHGALGFEWVESSVLEELW